MDLKKIWKLNSKLILYKKKKETIVDNFNQESPEKLKNLKRCSKCVLPETFPGIKFDEKGECNYCKTYEPMNPLGEEKFIKLLSKYKGKGEEFDVLVPISGGRDSAYVLHQIVKKYKMRYSET